MNQNRTAAKTTKNGMRQPNATLVWFETWKDSIGSSGL